MRQNLADTLVKITMVYIHEIDEETERTIAFEQDFEHLMVVFELRNAEFASEYLNKFKDWDQQTVDAFSVAISWLSNKYSDLVKAKTNC